MSKRKRGANGRTNGGGRRGGKALPGYDFDKDLLRAGGDAETSDADDPRPSADTDAATDAAADADAALAEIDWDNVDPDSLVIGDAPAGESSTAPADDGEADAPKIELPAFGLAADILAAYRKSQGAASSTASGEAETADEAEAPASADAAPDAPASSDAPGLDPQRLYAFTDQLSAEDAARRAQAHEETVEARIETWVTFSLADEIYALPVHPVHEVLRVSQITRVPHAPHPIRGVTQVRGRVIPVIDLRVRLGLPPVDISRVSRILVIGSRGRRLGLLVDGVHQVAHLDLNRLQAPPEDVMTEQSDFLAGVHEWNDQLLLLLDVDRVLILPAQAAGVA